MRWGETTEELDQLWQKLSSGGSTLMELGQYPFSDRYGWLQDKYGVSWQIAPEELLEVWKTKDAGRRERVMAAMMKMVKLDLAKLKAAAKPPKKK